MTSNRPYLVRAFFDWIVDNQMTPYLLVDAAMPQVDVPKSYITEDKIILNISPSATRALSLGQEYVDFQARFGGQFLKISVPIPAILAIYAHENGRGMVFDNEPTDNSTPPSDSPNGNGQHRPQLKLVK